MPSGLTLVDLRNVSPQMEFLANSVIILCSLLIVFDNPFIISAALFTHAVLLLSSVHLEVKQSIPVNSRK